MTRRTLLPLLAGVLASVGCASATPPPVDPSFRPLQKSKHVAFADPAALAEFEAPADEVYRISEGDRLNVLVWGKPELSGRKVVGPDGRVSLPLAGAVPVAMRTREEAEAALAERLRGYYLDPAVSVEVEEYAGNRIVLLGRVQNPGIIRFDGPPTLVEALSRAGALPVLDKKATLTRCAVIRGRDRLLWVDLKAILASGQLAYNIRLRPGDVVYIPDSENTNVYVLGEVQRPGAYSLTPDMTLLDALAQAGGPTEDAAPRSMRLIRSAGGTMAEIPLPALLDPKGGRNIGLEEGDILWVPRSGLASLGWFAQQVAPFVNMLVVGKVLTQ